MNVKTKALLTATSVGLLVYLTLAGFGCATQVEPTPSPTATPIPQVVSNEEVIIEALWYRSGEPPLKASDSVQYPETWYCDFGEEACLVLKLTNNSPHNIKLVGVGFGKTQIGNPSFFEGFILAATQPRSTEDVYLEVLREGFDNFSGRRFGFVRSWDESETILPAGEERLFHFCLIAKQAGEWETKIRTVAGTNTENRLSEIVIRVIVRPYLPKQ